MSVLVDERFGGTWDDLRAARAATTLPLLAKGFFSTPEHLARRATQAPTPCCSSCATSTTRAPRADARCTTLGLDTLVEAHDAEELERAVPLDAPVIGVNARDLVDVLDRPRGTARARRARTARPGRDRRERDRDARASRGRGARRRERDARRLDADAGRRSGREAARAGPAAARQGVRPDAPGGRRRGGRGRRRHGRLHPRRREPAPRRRLLDAPDTVLRVAVFVGESEETDADLVQFYEREDGHRSRDACCCAAASESARSSTCRGPRDASHLDRARATKGGSCSPAGWPRQRGRGDRRGAAVGGRLGALDRGGARGQAPRRDAPLGGGRAVSDFGDYGGRYVPETLIPALDELESAWRAARGRVVPRRAARARAGRPTPAGRRRSRAPHASRRTSASI